MSAARKQVPLAELAQRLVSAAQKHAAERPPEFQPVWVEPKQLASRVALAKDGHRPNGRRYCANCGEPGAWPGWLCLLCREVCGLTLGAAP